MLSRSLLSVACFWLLSAAAPTSNTAPGSANAAQASKHGVHYPPLRYPPRPSGVSFIPIDDTKAPWKHLHLPPGVNLTIPTNPKVISPSLCSALTPDNPTTYWLEDVPHNGLSSFLNSSVGNSSVGNSSVGSYSTFRNVVTDFQADNTGATDASSAIINAITAGAANGPLRSTKAYGTTGQPAVVYLPAGTYLLSSPLQFYLGTVFIGDPINPPTIKAAAGFNGDHVIYAKDPNYGGTNNFYISMKNVIIDSTAINPSTQITLLDWTVSQATQLTNVVFNMPHNSTGHTGMKIGEWAGGDGYNSNIIINDITFNGGAVGMNATGQQWVFRDLTFNGSGTCAVIGGTDVVVSGSRFSTCGKGIDASGTSGSLVVIDTAATGNGTFITSTNYYQPNGITLENVHHNGKTVVLGNQTLLTGAVADTWYRGNAYTSDNSTHNWTPNGTMTTTARSSVLLSGGKYISVAPPTYKEYSSSKFVNIKSVIGLPVAGDGVTDDTTNINAILSLYAGCSIIYWPAGTYIVTDTIFIPAGTRIFGDAYGSVISATGSNFKNATSPTTMVRVGNSGDVGIAQISNMLFTVADILPGCKLLEVNMAGTTTGDVGLWNTHFRVGGAFGSKVRTECVDSSPAECKAAWGLLHLTSTSSAYVENMWGWTADHDLDGADGNSQTISVGRGALVEATQGTWLVGTGMEHNTLYQYNFWNARNVYAAMQQSETPYWQGQGSPAVAPRPWAAAGELLDSDPAFADCDGDAQCGMAWFERVNAGSSDLFLYGGCVWVFFNNGTNNADGSCGNANTTDGNCQANAIEIQDATHTYLYGTNVHNVRNIVISNGGANTALKEDNTGGWGGVIAAYLFNT